MPSIAVKTLGCKVNQYDTEAMLELFEAAGYKWVPFEEEADVYLINTCTVTGTGDTKSLKLIRRVNREHPSSGIIVAGCLAQRIPEQLFMEGVRLIIGVQNRARVVELYNEALSTGKAINAAGKLNGARFEHLTVNRHEGKTRATMKIQEGCNRFCSYCVIPFVRGPIRSMEIADVKQEAERLSRAGYREIVVTGIHLGSYGNGTHDTLLDAIRAVAATQGVERVRLGSLEPVCITDDFAMALSQIPEICPQFHLSMQSGSETVLKRMNRRYTPDEYYEACVTLRRYMPSCAITTDVIAGFPGETEEEFKETCEFVKKVGFARIHVFPYSRRSGTKADQMPNQIPEDEKKRRANALIAIGDVLEENYVKNAVGSVQSVLFETDSEGYTMSYIRVKAQGYAGMISDVKITGCEGTLALGEMR